MSVTFREFIIIPTIGWIAVKFGEHIHGPQRISYIHFDPPSFHVAPSSGQNLIVSNTLVNDQKHTKNNDISIILSFSANYQILAC